MHCYCEVWANSVLWLNHFYNKGPVQSTSLCCFPGELSYLISRQIALVLVELDTLLLAGRCVRGTHSQYAVHINAKSHFKERVSCRLRLDTREVQHV